MQQALLLLTKARQLLNKMLLVATTQRSKQNEGRCFFRLKGQKSEGLSNCTVNQRIG